MSRFTKGQLAMLLESRRITPTLRNAKDLQWDVATLPRYGNPVSILHSDAYCITSGSRHKDAAWRFIEYAMSPEGQKIIAATGRTVPSHIETSKSDSFLDPTKAPKNAKVYLDAVPNLRSVPTISTWAEIEDAMEGILENAMYKGPTSSTLCSRRSTSRPGRCSSGGSPPDMTDRTAGLTLTGVHAAFGINGVDLDVARDELLVVLGPSGAGKTTLLRVIAGLEPVASGKCPHRRQGRHIAASGAARHQHGVPVLRPLSAPDRRRQHRLRSHRQGRAARRGGRAHTRRRRRARMRTPAVAQAFSAVGR